MVLGFEFGKVFPAGVGPYSPSSDAANWLSSQFGRSVETRRRYVWLRMVLTRCASSELQFGARIGSRNISPENKPTPTLVFLPHQCISSARCLSLSNALHSHLVNDCSTSNSPNIQTLCFLECISQSYHTDHSTKIYIPTVGEFCGRCILILQQKYSIATVGEFCKRFILILRQKYTISAVGEFCSRCIMRL